MLQPCEDSVKLIAVNFVYSHVVHVIGDKSVGSGHDVELNYKRRCRTELQTAFRLSMKIPPELQMDFHLNIPRWIGLVVTDRVGQRKRIGNCAPSSVVYFPPPHPAFSQCAHMKLH